MVFSWILSVHGMHIRITIYDKQIWPDFSETLRKNIKNVLNGSETFTGIVTISSILFSLPLQPL